MDTDLKQTQPREEQMATPARENQAGQASFASFANTRMTYVGSTLFARRADGLGGQFTTRGSVDNSFPMAAMATPRTFLEVKTVVGSATRGTYNGGGAGNDYTCTRGPGLAKAQTVLEFHSQRVLRCDGRSVLQPRIQRWRRRQRLHLHERTKANE